MKKSIDDTKMSLAERRTTSLSLKLNIPIAIFGLIVLLIIIRVVLSVSDESIEENIRKETQYITDGLVLLTEVDSSAKNLIRYVNAVATRASIVSLRVINNRDNIIVADKSNQNIGKSILDLVDDREAAIYLSHIENPRKGTHVKSYDNLIYETAAVSFIDPAENRFRSYTILLVFNKAKSLHKANTLILYVVLAFSVGIAVLIVAVYLLQRKILLAPLNKIGSAMINQQENVQSPLLDVSSDDEIGVLSDYYNRLISSKNLKERELNDAKKYIEGITDEAPVLLSYIDKNEIILTANKRHGVWFGQDSSFFAGKSLRLAFGEKLYALVQPHIEAVLQGQTVNFDLNAEFRDGMQMATFATFSPNVDEKNEVVGFFVCIEDRTAIIEAEERLVEYTNELEFQTWALEDAKEAAETSTRSKSEFLANMSHEIRTPINGVLGMLNLLIKEQLTEKQRRYAKLAHSSGESLLALINDILDFSKIEAGKLEIEKIPFNLYALVSEVADSFMFMADEKGIDLLLDIDMTLPVEVIGDPSRIRQILTNFISNAIKFTESGSVTLSVKLDAKEGNICSIRLSVTDTGVGIPEENQSSLFDSFSQVDASTTREYGGTGLGLAIVKLLAELMGGSVGMESEVGIGSCFWVVTHLESIENSSSQRATKDENLSIVFVSHSEPLCSIGGKYCENIAAEVHEVRSTEDCLRIVEDNGGEGELRCIVIYDVTNPHFDYREFHKKSDGHCVEMIPLVSVYQLEDKSKLSLSQNQRYISRPLKPLELFNTISAVANQTDESRQQQSDPHADSYQELANRAKVLLVEDNSINQEVALGILEPLGYHVDVASNGLEALTLLANHDVKPYRIILMDCQMPGMDGYETTKMIRRGKAGSTDKDITIIAMTANAMKGDKEKCIEAGMNDYVSKPVDPNVLENKLASWLGLGFKEVSSGSVSDETANMGGVWNKEGFYKRVRGKKERAEKLIRMFLEGMPERMERLQRHTEDGAVEDCSSVAHEIKGIAANLGGEALQGISEEIEISGKNDKIERIRDLLPQMRASYDTLQSLLADELD